MKIGILKIKAGLLKSERPKQSEHGADYKVFKKNEIRMSAIIFTYIIFFSFDSSRKKDILSFHNISDTKVYSACPGSACRQLQ